MNSEPRFWKGKMFPTLSATAFSFPSGNRSVTAQVHGKNTQATMAAAPKRTAQRQLITKSISG